MALNRIDPVAQSFIVEEPTYITKVDLFFQSADATIPVFLQLRRIVDNQPGQTILPFSQAHIPAANVLTSDNANVATTVTFSSPIFVDTGEYALSVGSDSRAYNVYVSELNGTDTKTGRRISEQPLIGSLFLSENLKLFQPDLFEDIKVNIYRAKFSTDVTATVPLELSGSGGLGTDITEALEVDPLEVYPGFTTMKVYHFNHGFINDSFVNIKNVSNANILLANGSYHIGNVVGLPGNVIQEQDFQISNVKLGSYTINLGASPILSAGNGGSGMPNVTSRSRFGGGYVRVFENTSYSSITPQNSIFKPANTSVSNKVITTTLGSTYTVDTTFSEIQNAVQNDFETERTIAGPTNKRRKASGRETFDYRIDMNTDNDRVSPVIDIEQLGVNFKRNLVNEPSFATVLKHEFDLISNIGSNNKGVGHKANFYLLSNAIGIINLANINDCNNSNAIINGSILNVSANTTLTGAGTYNSGLYRVLDVGQGTSSNVRIKVKKITGNAVITPDTSNHNVYSIVSTNDFVAEEAAVGGSAYSKYISRQIDFINPSTGVKFFFDVAKPSEASVNIYLKTKLAGDSTNMNTIEYEKVSNVTIQDSLGGEFVQFQKEVNNIDEFNSLVFKIVLGSTDNSKIAKIKNLRAIALR